MIPNDIGGWLGRVFDSAGEVDCTSSIDVQFWTPNHFRHRLCNSKVVRNNHYINFHYAANSDKQTCALRALYIHIHIVKAPISQTQQAGLLRSMSHFHMRSHFSSFPRSVVCLLLTFRLSSTLLSNIHLFQPFS